jgi:hypothetical protein
MDVIDLAICEPSCVRHIRAVDCVGTAQDSFGADRLLYLVVPTVTLPVLSAAGRSACRGPRVTQPAGSLKAALWVSRSERRRRDDEHQAFPGFALSHQRKLHPLAGSTRFPGHARLAAAHLRGGRTLDRQRQRGPHPGSRSVDRDF